MASANNNSLRTRVFGLDLMRAMAISLVLANHTIPLTVTNVDPNFKIIIDNTSRLLGFLGVELFFVLSGFLIGQILIKEIDKEVHFDTLWSFWMRRWFRTLPNYYLLFAFSVVILYFFTNMDLTSSWLYILFLQNFAWRISDVFLISWSLAIEEWFYLLFPLSVWIMSRYFQVKQAFIYSLLLFFLVSFVGRLLVAITDTSSVWDQDFRHIVWLRLDAPIFGVCAALLKSTSPKIWSRLCRSGLMVAIITFCIAILLFYTLDKDASILCKTMLFTIVSFGSMSLLPVLDKWHYASGKLAKSVRYISTWSYSIYLIHAILLFFVYMLLDVYPNLAQNILDRCILIILYITSSISLSALWYSYYEKPTTDLRDHWPFRRNIKW